MGAQDKFPLLFRFAYIRAKQNDRGHLNLVRGEQMIFQFYAISDFDLPAHGIFAYILNQGKKS